MTSTWSDRVIGALRLSSLPLDDDELARRLGAPQRQTINQTCRRLAAAGTLARYTGADGKIVNSLLKTENPPAPLESFATIPSGGSGLLSEDEVKAAVKAHLERGGWTVQVAWGRERGVDIRATRDGETLLIEAKGEAANPPQQVNYFIGALGELVQRMNDPQATYGLALPENRQYQGLVGRLPAMARERLNLVVYFVNVSERSVRQG